MDSVKVSTAALDAIVAIGQPDGSNPIAIVDIGSNSIRLVIYEGLTRAPNVLFNEKVQVGLGAGVAETGAISPEAMARAVAALTRFRALIDQAGVNTVHALATAAAREASNGREFIQTVNSILDVSVRIFSGVEEAEFAGAGVQAGFFKPKGMVGDMGGGSLEIMRLHKDELKHKVTLPLGGLRLDHDSGGNLKKARKIAHKLLGAEKAPKRAKGGDFFAVGGTWRNIATLHMAETDYPLHVIHDYQIGRSEAVAFCERLMSGDLEKLKGIQSVSASRKRLVPYGAAVLAECLETMNARKVRFSAFGVREGFLQSFLHPDVLRLDPLLTATHHFAQLRSRSVDHAIELCSWTGEAFAAFGIKETETQTRLRWAACLLADIAWRAHPDYRGQQSLNIIAHGDFVGMDHAGRAFLSLVAYYRNDGYRDGPVSEELTTLAGSELTERARLLGTLLRVGYLFSASLPRILGRLAISGNRDEGYVLRLPKDIAALDGERPRRRASQVGMLLGADFKILVEE